MPDQFNLTTLVVAILGSAGLGGAIQQLFLGLAKMRRGVAPRERGRRADLIAERDRASARADAAEAREDEQMRRAEREARNRWAAEDYSARLRRILIEQGLDRLMPQPPVMEQTVDGATIRDLREDAP